MKKLVIFDRDGTLVIDHGYTHKVKDLQWMNGALYLLRELNQIGISVVVATNQSGISRGYYSQADTELFHTQMSIEARAHGGKIDSFYMCPHSPDINGSPTCDCRKPNPGMLVKAMQDFQVTTNDCFFVGNSQSDLEAAEKLKIKFIFVENELNVKEILDSCKC